MAVQTDDIHQRIGALRYGLHNDDSPLTPEEIKLASKTRRKLNWAAGSRFFAYGLLGASGVFAFVGLFFRLLDKFTNHGSPWTIPAMVLIAAIASVLALVSIVFFVLVPLLAWGERSDPADLVRVTVNYAAIDIIQGRHIRKISPSVKVFLDRIEQQGRYPVRAEQAWVAIQQRCYDERQLVDWRVR